MDIELYDEIEDEELEKEIEEEYDSTANTDSWHLLLEDIKRYPILTPEEERELGIRKMNGDQEARQALINHNLRYVLKIAKKYKNASSSITLLDLFQEGVIGLTKAADKFDPDIGRFSTVATSWIEGAIGRAIQDTGRVIRLPANIFNHSFRIKRTYHELRQELKREPSKKEIADKLGISEKIIDYIINSDLVSLDTTPVSSEMDGVMIKDSIADESSEDPYEVATREALKDNLKKVLDTLPEKQARVISLRFGLEGNGEQLSLEKIGEIMGYSREWIRQMEIKALRKLRNPIRKRLIGDFLNE